MHVVTQSALLKALGWSLFNSLWQMGLLWLLYITFLITFKRASAQARHGLALLLAGAGAIWTGFSLIVHFFIPADGGASSTWMGGVFPGGEQTGKAFLQMSGNLIDGILPYCSFGYLVVLGVLFIRYTNHYLHARQLKVTGLSRIRPGFRLFADETSRLLGIRRKVHVWLSSSVEGPVTLGFLKPVILIPFATASNLSTGQVEAILLHELSHIKRNDYLVNLAVTVMEILFFFNPFSRLLIRHIRREREHCCDDLVMQFRYDPHTYVSALLALATGHRQAHQLALAATGGNDQLLLHRVRRILQTGNSSERPGIRPVIFLLCILAVSCITLSRAAHSRNVPASENTAAISIGLNPSAAETYPPLVPATESYPSSANPAFSSGSNNPVAASFPPVVPQPAQPLAPSQPGQPLPPKKPQAGREAPKQSKLTQAPDEDDQPETDDQAVQVSNEIMAANRDYSITASSDGVNAAPGTTASRDQLPFVPQASFSFQKTDTAGPGERYAYYQRLAAQEMELSMKKIQKQLQGQLQALRTISSNQQDKSSKMQKQILLEQLKLQEQCLEKQLELQKTLERTIRIRRIVVI